jgi:5-methylcytosine-specific restriction endonuclease McrA
MENNRMRRYDESRGIEVKKCSRCHIEKPINEFYSNGKSGYYHGKCKVCEKTTNKERYDANPEKYRTAVRESALKYPDRVRARYQRWDEANREQRMHYYREYNDAHREEKRQGYRLRRMNMPSERRKTYYAQHNFTRRARLVNALRTERIDKQALIERDKWTCYICGCICIPENITLDHVIPLSRGGTHTADNLRVACKSCNGSKGAKSLHEFLA